MAVYVDALVTYPQDGRQPVQRCHMWADSLLELVTFAENLGLTRWQFHWHKRHPHYDLSVLWRTRAINAGACEMSYKDYKRGKPA